MGVASEITNGNKPIGDSSSSEDSSSSLVALYTLTFGDIKSWFGKARVALNVLTNKSEFMWDVVKPQSPNRVYSVKGRPHPDYALVFEQKQEGPEGYVLHQGMSSSLVYCTSLKTAFS